MKKHFHNNRLFTIFISAVISSVISVLVLMLPLSIRQYIPNTLISADSSWVVFATCIASVLIVSTLFYAGSCKILRSDGLVTAFDFFLGNVLSSLVLGAWTSYKDGAFWYLFWVLAFLTFVTQSRLLQKEVDSVMALFGGTDRFDAIYAYARLPVSRAEFCEIWRDSGALELIQNSSEKEAGEYIGNVYSHLYDRQYSGFWW